MFRERVDVTDKTDASNVIVNVRSVANNGYRTTGRVTCQMVRRCCSRMAQAARWPQMAVSRRSTWPSCVQLSERPRRLTCQPLPCDTGARLASDSGPKECIPRPACLRPSCCPACVGRFIVTNGYVTSFPECTVTLWYAKSQAQMTQLFPS